MRADSRPALHRVDTIGRLHNESFQKPVRCRSGVRALGRVGVLVMWTGAAACSGSTRGADRAAPDAPALFAQACAKCHAADGSGGLPTVANGPRPVDLTAAEWQRARTDTEIVTAIRSGRGAMPPFDGVLTAEQSAALAAYIRTLARR